MSLSQTENKTESDKLEEIVEHVYNELSNNSTAERLNDESFGVESEIDSLKTVIDEADYHKTTIEISNPITQLRNELIFKIFGHTTLIDQLLGLLVCKRYSVLLRKYLYTKKTNLDLTQLWLFINSSTDEKIFNLFCEKFLKNKFGCVRKLNLSYCKFLDDLILNKILDSLTSSKGSVISMNLYCCYNITDEAIKSIVRFQPGIKSLTLARCNNITVQGIKYILENLKSLSFLSVMHIKHLPLQIVEYTAIADNLQTMDVRGCFSNNKENHHIIEQYIKKTNKCKIIYKSTNRSTIK